MFQLLHKCLANIDSGARFALVSREIPGCLAAGRASLLNTGLVCGGFPNSVGSQRHVENPLRAEKGPAISAFWDQKQTKKTFNSDICFWELVHILKVSLL